MIALIAALLLSAVTAHAADPGADARRELRQGLLAHMDRDDRSAVRHFGRCLALAAPDGDDASSCRIYKEMFGRNKAKDDGASKPAARRKYKAAVAAFKKGDLAAAERGWNGCLEDSQPGTAVRNDCLAAIDLLPPKAAASAAGEPAARQVYIAGMMYYSQGLNDKAAEAWTRCAKEAPRGSDTENDCRAGLEKLKSH